MKSHLHAEAKAIAPMGNQGAFRLSYLPCLDGLRACSILFVIITHAALPDIRADRFGAAFIGVDIFFVLSGFLITSLLVQEWQHTGAVSLRRFYARRALRLLPALFLVLGAFVIYGWVVNGKRGGLANAADALIPLLYVANWTRALGLERPLLFPHTWSLSIEEQFYLLWPLALLLLLKTCRSWASLLRVLVLALYAAIVVRILFCEAGATAMRVVNGTDTRCDALLFGCLLAGILSSGFLPKSHPMKVSIRLAAWISVPALLSLAFRRDFNQVFAREVFYPLVSLCAALIILEVVTDQQGLLCRCLSQPYLVYIGKISYGLYLWHVPIFITVFSYGWSRGKEIVVALFATAVASVGSYYLVERRALKLKGRLHYPACVNDTGPVPALLSRNRGSIEMEAEDLP